MKEADSNEQARTEVSDSELIEASDSIAEVAQALQEMLLNTWKSFLEHMPYLLVGILPIYAFYKVCETFRLDR